MQDIQVFDADALAWVDVGKVTGEPPSPRGGMGMTTVGRRVVVFGGYDGNGEWRAVGRGRCECNGRR